MARQFAQNRIAMWNDNDFRHLSDSAQNLYSYLLAHPTTSYAGVVDWRPARLQSVTPSWDAARVEAIGWELAAGHYIVIDEDTEEASIRSFLRWESVLKSPNLTRAVVKAFNKVQSRVVRGTIAYEVLRLRDDEPSWAAWDVDSIYDILETEPINGKGLTLPERVWETLSSTHRSAGEEGFEHESANTSPITSNQITDNKYPYNLQQSTRDEIADDDESIEGICKRQATDAFKVDYVKVRNEIQKACGLVPDPTDIIRIIASILARAGEPPAKPTAFVLTSVKNNWPEWQKLIHETAVTS